MKLKVPEFVVGESPVEASVLDEVGRTAAKRVRTSTWLVLPVLFICLALGVGAYKALCLLVPFDEQASPGSEAMQSLTVIVSALAAFMGPWMGFSAWRSFWINVLYRVHELGIEDAEEALRLADRYVAINTWVKEIVQKRKIRNGEFDAMKKYAEATNGVIKAQEIRNKMEASYQKLHDPNRDAIEQRPVADS